MGASHYQQVLWDGMEFLEFTQGEDVGLLATYV
jgi:hypothetical protein